MSRLIIAFGSDDAARRVSEMFASSGLQVRGICRSGAEAIRAVRYMGSGVIVCGTKLPDMSAEEVFESLEGAAYMLVVARPELLDLIENRRIFRLPLPVNRYDLSAAAEMLIQLEEMNRAAPPGSAAVEKAKLLLVSKRGFTEKQAHYHLQKVSMATGKKLADVAQEIIDEMTSEEL